MTVTIVLIEPEVEITVDGVKYKVGEAPCKLMNTALEMHFIQGGWVDGLIVLAAAGNGRRKTFKVEKIGRILISN
ncbi:MAG: hypothetical protein AAB443_01255 [Patescibacteria group bacterium]